jgi:hypothetical protein
MKNSYLVALVCCLTVSGFNSFDRSAVAQESLIIDRASAVTNSETETFVVTQLGDKYGYADTKGIIKSIPAQFDNAYDFFDGLAAVRMNNKWGYIDKSGNQIIPFQFSGAGSFESGLAAVKIKDKWGYINQQGVMVIAASFDEAEIFAEGLGRIKVGSKWGFIDKQGTMKIDPTFDEATNFNKGTAWVQIGQKAGYIDETGKFHE